LTRILQHQTPDLPDVRPLGFTGYCREAKAYVFGQLAVANGRVFRPNDDDFFQIGKQAIKLGTSERLLDIEYDADRLDTSWLADLWTAYGAKGLVCLSFFFGSLFAEQVRTEMKSFPFLEMHGLPGTGKTTLVEFLWKLLGRENYEGFDPAKATPAAMARNLGKVGNLPVVLIEGDRREEASHARKFEWEELKTAYNGRTVRARGVRNGGMETFEPPFRGAIVIEQNEPVNASRAVLERIMSLGFDMTGWSAQTKASAERRAVADRDRLGLHRPRRQARERGHGPLPAGLCPVRGGAARHARHPHQPPRQDPRAVARLPRCAARAAPDHRRTAGRHGQVHRRHGGRAATGREQRRPHRHPVLGAVRLPRGERGSGGAERPHQPPSPPCRGIIAVRLNEMEARCAEKRLELPTHAELIRALKTSKTAASSSRPPSIRGTRACPGPLLGLPRSLARDGLPFLKAKGRPCAAFLPFCP
jgi:hypothetical protein